MQVGFAAVAGSCGGTLLPVNNNVTMGMGTPPGIDGGACTEQDSCYDSSAFENASARRAFDTILTLIALALFATLKA